MNLWLIVLSAVIVVLGGILILRQHAFLVLLVASLLVATLTDTEALDRFAAQQVASGKMTQPEADAFAAQSPPQRLAGAFGEMAANIGILIALASVIGSSLAASGGAAVIAERMLRLSGPRRAPEALAASAFVLGIPVFFDTVFYLMIPLARSLRRQLGRDYVLFICAIMAGGSIAHSLVPPTPGPLLVAGMLEIEIGTMLVAGTAVACCTSGLSLVVARLINRHVEVPLRALDGTSAEMAAQEATDPPSLWESMLPIVLPVSLIAVGSVTAYLIGAGSLEPGAATGWIEFLADKNIAIGVGAALALRLIRHCPQAERAALVGGSLSAAGGIILITAVGGALGAMLRHAGIGQAVAEISDQISPALILPTAFVITAAIRTLQGSATVAMITAAGVLQGFAESQSLPFHPVYLALAIGVGSKPISWMNDSGFWVITRMSGMTDAEGLRVVTPMLTAMGLCGLAVVVLFATLFPAAG